MRGGVWIRADAGTELGAGHIARCRALAEVLSAGGVSVHWACRRDPLVFSLLGREPDVEVPGQPSFAALDARDAEVTHRVSTDADWLVVDHYGAADSWLEGLRSQGRRVLVIDDHLNRRSADLRLAPTWPSSACDQGDLVGCDYALIHPAFPRRRMHSAEDRERRGLVVCFGGSDPHGHTAALLRTLSPSVLRACTVVLGDHAAGALEVDALLQAAGGYRRAWLDPVALADLFAGCAAAVVSASGIALEAMTMNAPLVALAWVDNQRHHAQCLRKLGVSVVDRIVDAAALASKPLAAPQSSIDGLGAWRVARAMGYPIPVPQLRAA